MARRGIFGRIRDFIFGPRETRQPPAAPQPVSPPVATPSIRDLRRRAVDNVVSSLPLANRSRVTEHFTFLDREELQWAADASADQLRWRARQDADRTMEGDDGETLPLNPFWYH